MNLSYCSSHENRLQHVNLTVSDPDSVIRCTAIFNLICSFVGVFFAQYGVSTDSTGSVRIVRGQYG